MRQNAASGAPSACTTAALTTPPWVIATARPSQRACSSSHAATRAAKARQALAAVRASASGSVIQAPTPAGSVAETSSSVRPAQRAEVALGERGVERGGSSPAAAAVCTAAQRRAAEHLAARRQARRERGGGRATALVERLVGGERGAPRRRSSRRGERGAGVSRCDPPVIHLRGCTSAGSGVPDVEGLAADEFLTPGAQCPGHSGATVPDSHRVPRAATLTPTSLYCSRPCPPATASSDRRRRPGFDASRAAERAAEPRGWRFADDARDAVHRVIAERRDIRRFRPDEVPARRAAARPRAPRTARRRSG